MALRVSRYDVEKFDGKNNFSMWQVEVKDILVKDGLSEALDGKPQGMKENEWISFDQQACSTIRLCLSKEIKHNVITDKSAKEIWEKLEKLYLEKSLTNRINLKKEFYRFTMDGSTTLQDHLNEFIRMLTILLNFEVKSGAIFTAEGKALKVEGIGAVKIKTHDGAVKVLEDVRYVPIFTRSFSIKGRWLMQFEMRC